MSLQPSNIPQLQNVGLNPAASMLSSSISTLVGAEQAEKNRRNKLLQSLLGGAVNMGEQVLRNRGNLAMTEAQIMSPAQQALALNRLATGAAGLGQAGGISGGVDNVLGQLGIGNRQSPQKELLDGTPSSDQMGLDAGGAITGVPQGQEFTKTPPGAFQLGASQQTVLPPTSAGIPADLPLGMSQSLAKINRDVAGKELSEARERKTNIDAQRSQIGLEQEEKARIDQGFAVRPTEQTNQSAVDYDGVPLNIPNTERVFKIQKSFARLPKKEVTEARNKVANSFQDLQQFTNLTKRFLSLRESNLIDRQRVNAAINGQIPFDQLREVEQVAVELNSLLEPAAIQAAAQFQGANSISNRDVEGIKNAIGNPKLPKEVFANLISRYLTKSYINGVGSAIGTDAVLFNDMRSNFQNLTGSDLTPEDFVKFDEVKNKVKNALVSGSQGGVISPVETTPVGNTSTGSNTEEARRLLGF